MICLKTANKAMKESVNFTLRTSCVQMTSRQVGPGLSWSANATDRRCSCVVVVGIEVASVIELSEASGRVAAGLFMTEG